MAIAYDVTRIGSSEKNSNKNDELSEKFYEVTPEDLRSMLKTLRDERFVCKIDSHLENIDEIFAVKEHFIKQKFDRWMPSILFYYLTSSFES